MKKENKKVSLGHNSNRVTSGRLVEKIRESTGVWNGGHWCGGGGVESRKNHLKIHCLFKSTQKGQLSVRRGKKAYLLK